MLPKLARQSVSTRSRLGNHVSMQQCERASNLSRLTDKVNILCSNPNSCATAMVNSMSQSSLISACYASLLSLGLRERSSTTVPEESPAAMTGNAGHTEMLVKGCGAGLSYTV